MSQGAADYNKMEKGNGYTNGHAEPVSAPSATATGAQPHHPNVLEHHQQAGTQQTTPGAGVVQHTTA